MSTPHQPNHTTSSLDAIISRTPPTYMDVVLGDGGGGAVGSNNTPSATTVAAASGSGGHHDSDWKSGDIVQQIRNNNTSFETGGGAGGSTPAVVPAGGGGSSREQQQQNTITSAASKNGGDTNSSNTIIQMDDDNGDNDETALKGGGEEADGELTEQEMILMSYDTYGDNEALKAVRFVGGFTKKGVSLVTPQFVKTGVSTAVNATENALNATVDATKSAAGKTASVVPQPIGKAVHATTEAVGTAMNFAGHNIASLASTTGNLLEAAPEMMINLIPDSFMSKETKHLIFVDFNNTLHSFFHTNILTMPYLFNEAGLLMGILITIFVAIISELAVETFYRVKYKYITDPTKQKVWVYGDLPKMMWGDWYPTLNILHGVLHLIGFQIFAAGNVKVLLREWFNYTDVTGVKVLGCVIPSLCALPLIFLKQSKHQRPLAISSNFLTFLAAFILLLNFNWNTVASDVDYFSESYDRLGVALGVAVYIFSGIGSTLVVERTMEPLTYISLLRKAIFGSSAALLLFGVVGYLSYGEGTCAVIVLSLQDGKTKSAVALVLFFASVSIIPLQTFPFTELIDRRFLELKKIPEYGHIKANAQRIFVVVFGGAVSYYVPFYGLISAVGGSFTCVILSLIVPFALDYTINGGFGSGFLNWPFTRLVVIGGFGLFVLIVSLTATIYDITVKISSSTQHTCN